MNDNAPPTNNNNNPHHEQHMLMDHNFPKITLLLCLLIVWEPLLASICPCLFSLADFSWCFLAFSAGSPTMGLLITGPLEGIDIVVDFVGVASQLATPRISD
jgi:hypothetical protein